MRVFITVLILIFSLQSLTKADDIRDFQIEGMSIGDSALDYFSKSEINKLKRYDNTNTAWTKDEMYSLRTKQKGPYTEIMLALKKNDGEIFYKNFRQKLFGVCPEFSKKS